MFYNSEGTSKKQICKWHGALQCSKGLHNEILIPLLLSCQHTNLSPLLILTDDIFFFP